MKLKIASDRTLMKTLRGQTVRPKMVWKDRKKEQARTACRQPVEA